MAEGSNLVGVDIGSSSVKVCQLKESRKGLELVRLGFAPLPSQTIVDGHVMNSGAVVETLSRLFHDRKIKQRDVRALSESRQSAFDAPPQILHFAWTFEPCGVRMRWESQWVQPCILPPCRTQPYPT